jgi:hypothetical protein
VLYSLLLRDSVAFRVRVPTDVPEGQPVRIELRLTNKTERPLVLPWRGRPLAVQVAVARADGMVVWRSREAALVPADPRPQTLEPAETLRFEAEWDGRIRTGAPAPPGRYLVTGALPIEGSEDLAAAPAPLQILPETSIRHPGA